MDPQAAAWMLLIAVLFGIVLTACWIVLPFAVIGTKPILRELLREQQRTNELLARLAPPDRSAAEPTRHGSVERRYPPSASRDTRFAGSPNLPPT